MTDHTPPLCARITLDRGMPVRIEVLVDWHPVSDGTEFTVPAAFVSDGASMPVAPWWFPISVVAACLALLRFGRLRSLPASVFHDWAYTGAIPRREADRRFRRMLACNGVGVLGRWVAWLGVRLGGWAHYRR